MIKSISFIVLTHFLTHSHCINSLPVQST